MSVFLVYLHFASVHFAKKKPVPWLCVGNGIATANCVNLNDYLKNKSSLFNAFILHCSLSASIRKDICRSHVTSSCKVDEYTQTLYISLGSLVTTITLFSRLIIMFLPSLCFFTISLERHVLRLL